LELEDLEIDQNICQVSQKVTVSRWSSLKKIQRNLLQKNKYLLLLLQSKKLSKNLDTDLSFIRSVTYLSIKNKSVWNGVRQVFVIFGLFLYFLTKILLKSTCNSRNMGKERRNNQVNKTKKWSKDSCLWSCFLQFKKLTLHLWTGSFSWFICWNIIYMSFKFY
jgi:Mn2+/Fe2+ NRAMP family transporter